MSGRAAVSTAGLKWFCAISAATLDYADYSFRDLIRVAIGSALRNTRLQPHLIHDGPESEFTAQMRALGAAVILHQSPLREALRVHAGDRVNWFHVLCGAYLRFEVPMLETHDEFALYTDCDVMFLRDPVFGASPPAMFGATSEFSMDPQVDMNSGVMLMNLPNMRKILPELYQFARGALHLGTDQEVLKAFFGQAYLKLDISLNWKPYWGWNPQAQIVHFHGPKPFVARDLLVDGKLIGHNDHWARLLLRDTASYEAYTRLWFLYCDSLVPRSGAMSRG